MFFVVFLFLRILLKFHFFVEKMETSKFAISHRSAFCLIPPESLWAPIQRIRETYDKQFHRWMPHVNVLYPFYENKDDQFEICSKIAQNVCENFAPIRLRFTHESFKHLKHGKNNCTMVLMPCEEETEKLRNFHAKLQAAFPEAGDKRFPEFKPHLSLGQFTAKNVEAKKTEFASEWKNSDVDLEWNLSEIFMISRADFNDPFRIIHEIKFLNK